MALENKEKMALAVGALGIAIQLYSQHSTKLSSDKKRQYHAVGQLTMYTGFGLFLYFMFKKA